MPIICCQRGRVWMFQELRSDVASFRLALRGNVSKVVWPGRGNAFALFSEDDWRFSWHAQHVSDLDRHVAWHAQHFGRVVLRFLLRIPLSVLSNSAAGVAFREM